MIILDKHDSKVKLFRYANIPVKSSFRGQQKHKPPEHSVTQVL